jgi:hypothetical protein
MNFIRWVVGAFFIFVCVIFAISNRDLIDLHFWPFPYAFTTQTGLAVLLPTFITFLLGGVWVSFGKTKLWARARQTEKHVLQLEAALQRVQEQLRQNATNAHDKNPTRKAARTPLPPEPRQLKNN